MRVKLGVARLPLAARCAIPGLARLSDPADRRRQPNPKPIGRPPGPTSPKTPHRSPDLANPDCRPAPCLSSAAATAQDSHCSRKIGIPCESENDKPCSNSARGANTLRTGRTRIDRDHRPRSVPMDNEDPVRRRRPFLRVSSALQEAERSARLEHSRPRLQPIRVPLLLGR